MPKKIEETKPTKETVAKAPAKKKTTQVKPKAAVKSEPVEKKKSVTAKKTTTKVTAKKAPAKKTVAPKKEIVKEEVKEEVVLKEELPPITPVVIEEPPKKKESFFAIKFANFILIVLLIGLGAYGIYETIFKEEAEKPEYPTCKEEPKTNDSEFSINDYVKESKLDGNRVVFDYICSATEDCNKELVTIMMDEEMTRFDLEYTATINNEISAGVLRIEANDQTIISEDIMGGAHLEYFKTYLNHYFVVAKSYSDNHMIVKLYDKEGRLVTEINTLKGTFYGLEGINFYHDKIIYFANDNGHENVVMHVISIENTTFIAEKLVDTTIKQK